MSERKRVNLNPLLGHVPPPFVKKCWLKPGSYFLECDTNVDVTKSQQKLRSSSTLFNSLANIAAKAGL